MLKKDIQDSINSFWEEKIIPTLSAYIEIPAKSPAFDSEWQKNGHIESALKLATTWIEKQKIANLRMEVLRSAGRTPLLLLDMPGDTDQLVLMYGHLDKQPEMTGWSEGLQPWKSVRRENRLYGRGGADDGYAVFAAVCGIQHLLKYDLKRPHIKVVIELSEESGSPDLPIYFNEYAEKFGEPHLVICLDSGAGNYDQFWMTTSLRGLVSGNLTVKVLNEGVHSGSASGIVPSSFRIVRMLLNRIEDVETGEITLAALKCEIPADRRVQAEQTAKSLQDGVSRMFPTVEGLQSAGDSPLQNLLNRTWKAALSVVGADGLPLPEKAGNVLRPSTSLKLSMRLPPTIQAGKAANEMKRVLEENPPYGAEVSFHIEDAASGWNAPTTKLELENLVQEASRIYFGDEALAFGEGGSIPFMGMLGEKYPNAQFVITGVLGPNSNAHGPNEFIHLDYAKKLTACIVHILNGVTASEAFSSRK